MFQHNLLFVKDLSKEYLRKFELIFSVLPTMAPPLTTLGRPPHPFSAMLHAFIFKNLRGLRTLSALTQEIHIYQTLIQLCGFRSPPSKERFSSFLQDTPNEKLQSVRENLVQQLIERKEISGKYLSTDSCPIESPVRENNLKTNVSDRFNKTRFIKGDPQCRLGVYLIYPQQRQIRYFWGYRNHIINDAISELPITELTKPADVSETTLLIPQLKYLKNTFHLDISAVIGDAIFDSYQIIEFIVKELKAQPIIPRNPRAGKNPAITLSRAGIPACIAGFQMISRGNFYDRLQGRWRHKFICPIKASKTFAKTVNFLCPWNHPKFYSNRYGCTTNLRTDVDQSIRNSIDYSSQTFKKLYALRTSSERIFSRLLILCMQDSSVKGLNATANICTLAHISVLAVALASSKSGQKDKIRFIKGFFLPSSK